MTIAGEDYNSNAGCFYSNMVSQSSGLDYSKYTPTSRCYEFSCGPPDLDAFINSTIVDTHLFVKIGSYWMRCPQEGGYVLNKANQFNGKIFCPPVDVMCSKNSTRLSNFNSDVADRVKNARVEEDIWKWAKDLSWWVWLIIGLGCGAIVIIFIGILIFCFCRNKVKMGGKWNTKKTIDIRNIDMMH